jgi:uncharacterized protein (TIRG00374 family)
MSGITTQKTIQNIFLLIGLFALAIMVYKLGFTTIVENIRHTGWWFIPIIGIWGIVYVLNTLSYMLIIRDNSSESKNVKFPTLYKVTISTFAINSATPIGLAGGEPYKFMELKQYVGTSKATSSVILFSMMHFVSHFLFWILSIILVAMTVSLKEGWTGTLIGIFCVCVFLIFLFFKGYRKGMIMNLLRILVKIPFLRRWVRAFTRREYENIKAIDYQIISLHSENKLKFYSSLGIEFFARILSCAEVYFILTALGSNITYIQCILIMAFTSLFANILFFSPMQLGTREAGFLLVFKMLGLDPASAVSTSLITRIRELCWMMIGFLLMKVTLKDGSIKLRPITHRQKIQTSKAENG